MALRILCCLADLCDRRLVSTAFNQIDAVFCRGPASVVIESGRAPLAGVLWEIGAESPAETLAAIRSVNVQFPTIPHLFRIDLCRSHAADFQALAAESSIVSAVSVRGMDDLVADLVRLRQPNRHRTPELRIIAPLSQLFDGGEIAEIVVAAILSGKRRITVEELASSCQRSASGLEKVLRAARLPSPKRLLEWSLCLHVAWRVDILRWTVTETAVALGFGTRDALTNRISRHFGNPPTRLTRAGGFSFLLDQFLAELRPRSSLRAYVTDNQVRCPVPKV